MPSDVPKPNKSQTQHDVNKILEGREHWLEKVAPGLPQFEKNRHRWTELVNKLILENYKPDRVGRIQGQADKDWYREVISRASLLRESSLKRPDGVYEFEWDNLKIRCLLAQGLVMAWVGSGKFGRIVLFDEKSFQSAEKLSSRIDYLVYGLAVSWFVDVHSLCAGGLATIENDENVYKPNSLFLAFLSAAKSAPEKIPRLSFVIGHLRELPVGHKPSRDQRNVAPNSLQSEMGPRHTFVQAHVRREVSREKKKEVVQHLQRYSALASALALLEK
jgi:hypothetical protein